MTNNKSQCCYWGTGSPQRKSDKKASLQSEEHGFEGIGTGTGHEMYHLLLCGQYFTKQ